MKWCSAGDDVAKTAECIGLMPVKWWTARTGGLECGVCLCGLTVQCCLGDSVECIVVCRLCWNCVAFSVEVRVSKVRVAV